MNNKRCFAPSSCPEKSSSVRSRNTGISSRRQVFLKLYLWAKGREGKVVGWRGGFARSDRPGWFRLLQNHHKSPSGWLLFWLFIVSSWGCRSKLHNVPPAASEEITHLRQTPLNCFWDGWGGVSGVEWWEIRRRWAEEDTLSYTPGSCGPKNSLIWDLCQSLRRTDSGPVTSWLMLLLLQYEIVKQWSHLWGSLWIGTMTGTLTNMTSTKDDNFRQLFLSCCTEISNWDFAWLSTSQVKLNFNETCLQTFFLFKRGKGTSAWAISFLLASS